MTRVDKEAHEFTVRELCHAKDGVAPEYTYRIGTYSITNLYNLVSALVTARELGVSAKDLQRTLADGKVNVTAARFSEETVKGMRLVNTASKGENSTATSTALATICREPGSKAVVLMLADTTLPPIPRRPSIPVGIIRPISSIWRTQPSSRLLSRVRIRTICC